MCKGRGRVVSGRRKSRQYQAQHSSVAAQHSGAAQQISLSLAFQIREKLKTVPPKHCARRIMNEVEESQFHPYKPTEAGINLPREVYMVSSALPVGIYAWVGMCVHMYLRLFFPHVLFWRIRRIVLEDSNTDIDAGRHADTDKKCHLRVPLTEFCWKATKKL